MRLNTLPLLRCPTGCTPQLNLDASGCRDDVVRDGLLKCAACGRSYPIEDGIALMLPGGLQEDVSGIDPVERARKRSEMAARDAQVEDYDKMRGLALFGKIEIPVTMAKMNLAPQDVLIEAGCGTGRMTPTFAAKCRSVLAIDFSLESLRVCRRKLDHAGITNVDLIQADACALPFRSEIAPKVVSCQVLEHLPTTASREKMVSELARTAQPGGTIVISAYQHSLFTRLFGQKEGEHDGGIYFYRFHRRELRELLSSALEVRNITGALVYHYLARCRKPAETIPQQD